MNTADLQPAKDKKPDKINTAIKIGVAILTSGVIIFFLGMWLFSDDSTPPSTETSTETSVETPKTAPLLSKGSPIITTTEFGNIVVEGIVRNDGNAKAIWVKAEATFYDSGKNIVGRYSDYLDELIVGESWRYSIMYLGIDENLVKSASVKVTHQ